MPLSAQGLPSPGSLAIARDDSSRGHAPSPNPSLRRRGRGELDHSPPDSSARHPEESATRDTRASSPTMACFVPVNFRCEPLVKPGHVALETVEKGAASRGRPGPRIDHQLRRHPEMVKRVEKGNTVGLGFARDTVLEQQRRLHVVGQVEWCLFFDRLPCGGIPR